MWRSVKRSWPGSGARCSHGACGLMAAAPASEGGRLARCPEDALVLAHLSASLQDWLQDHHEDDRDQHFLSAACLSPASSFFFAHSTQARRSSIAVALLISSRSAWAFFHPWLPCSMATATRFPSILKLEMAMAEHKHLITVHMPVANPWTAHSLTLLLASPTKHSHKLCLSPDRWQLMSTGGLGLGVGYGGLESEGSDGLVYSKTRCVTQHSSLPWGGRLSTLRTTIIHDSNPVAERDQSRTSMTGLT